MNGEAMTMIKATSFFLFFFKFSDQSMYGYTGCLYDKNCAEILCVIHFPIFQFKSWHVCFFIFLYCQALGIFISYALLLWKYYFPSAFNNNLNNAFFFLWLEFILKWSSVSEYLRRSFLMFPLWSPVSLVPAVVEKALWAHMSIKSTRVNTGVTLEIKGLLFFIIFIFYLWWILSYIEMKQPWVYMCSPSRSPLPLPSPPAPSRFTQCTRSERLYHASNLGWWSVSP